MNKKVFIVVGFCFFVVIGLSAQIRNYVAIVRPVFDEKTVAFLLSLSESMRRDGYPDAAGMLKAYAEGGYGSGFVYVDNEGKNYIVTNRHVVSQAGSVALEFEQEDGVKTVYENCRVIAVDDDLDIALISFPSNKRPFRRGLLFSKQKIEDGMTVWSAGYPGLISEPMWQLGNGTVTNNKARVPELANPEITTLIQHSAQVDAGNSGGPLMIRDTSTQIGYRVIGINTWKVVGRQATNFALPASAVEEFIKQTLQTIYTDKRSQIRVLEKRCKDFVKAISDSETAHKNAVRFISYEFVVKEGENLLKDALAWAPTDIRNDILDIFVNVNPIEGIRMAIAYSIGRKINSVEKKELNFISIDNNTDASGDSAPASVLCKLGEQDIRIVWKQEHGKWRIVSFPLFETPEDDEAKKDEKKKSDVSVDIEAPYDMLIYGVISCDIDFSEILYGGGFHYNTYDYFGTALNVLFGQIPYTDYSGSTESEFITLFQFSLYLQVPLDFGDFAVIPYAKGGMEIPLGDASFDYMEASPFFWGGGMQVGFGENPGYYMGGEVKVTIDEFENTYYINFYAGIGL
jgi:serine protease Do